MSIMQRQDWSAFVATSRRSSRRVAVGLLSVVALIILAGCAASQPAGVPIRAPQVLATDTETPQPADTLTPLPTATPTPSPTPLAALSAGVLPGGQVFFSTVRAGDPRAELWQVDASEGLRVAQEDIAPGLWQCASGAGTHCAFVAGQGALLATLPSSGTLALLDDLSPLAPGQEAPSPTSTDLVSVTAALSSTSVLSQTATFSETSSQPPPLNTTTPVSRSLAMLQLALAPDGTTLAVATSQAVKVFDLTAQTLEAQLQVADATALAWSPDSSTLAVAYGSADGVATLALWNWQDGDIPALAVMQEVADLAWAPDGAKLAFAARREPLTPTSQGGQFDVFVVYLRSGEIANLTEVFVGNKGLPADEQVAAWAPEWEADSSSVRYILGVPGVPETQTLMRHTLRSRRPTVVGAAPEPGTVAASSGSADLLEARIAARDGRQVVQVRTADTEWRDASPGTFESLQSLAWAPASVDAVGSGAAAQTRHLLLQSRQALYILDVISGQIGGLAVACPTCTIERAVWLP